jgi:predicted N-acetyltransferase YhbS
MVQTTRKITMNITIRSEQIADYDQIAELTTLAFHSMLDDQNLGSGEQGHNCLL